MLKCYFPWRERFYSPSTFIFRDTSKTVSYIVTTVIINSACNMTFIVEVLIHPAKGISNVFFLLRYVYVGFRKELKAMKSLLQTSKMSQNLKMFENF